MRISTALPFLAAMSLPAPAFAQVAAADSGDTAWMILCAVLVLLAALPGLLLRHAGAANVRNGLSVAAQGLLAIGAISLAWGIVGYSLAYAPGSAWLGGGGNLLLAGLGTLRDGLTVPESAFVLFQMALALFSGCLLVGAVAERARFGWVAGFGPLWLLIVYAPVAHWAWGGGWLADVGVMDFAGGLVVQGTAGFSALALALIVGRRREPTDPGHAPVLGLAGGALLWVGWSGMVGGWALGATDDAAAAILNMHFAACAAALVWALLDRLLTGRTSATGVMAGAVAGLAGISASAALVGTGGAMLVGVVAAFLCRIGWSALRDRVDDPAGVFVLHGLGGITGSLLLPVFVMPQLGGVGFDAGITVTGALISQLVGIAIIGLWSMVGSAIAALLVSVVIPMRVDATQESEGLDTTQHGQQSWDFR